MEDYKTTVKELQREGEHVLSPFSCPGARGEKTV